VKAKIWMPNKENAVDVTEIMQYIRILHRDYNLKAVAYDPRLFEVPSSMLRDERINMVEFPQSIERMTPAIGDLYTALMQTQLTHDHDDQFGQQVLNAIPRYNERGFMLSKEKSNGKIDACISLAMVWGLYTHPERLKSPLVCL